MKRIAFFLLCFQWIVVNGQTKEDLFKADTIFICFKKGKNQLINKNLFVSKQHPEVRVTEYIFIFPSNKKNLYNFKFQYSSHDMTKIPIEKIKVIQKRKIFLRKRKNETLNYKLLKTLEKSEIKLLFFNLKYKTIFLIDKNEIKRRRVLLRRVFLSGGFLETI